MKSGITRKPGRRQASAARKRRARSRGLRHVLETGLPPGIEQEHFRDPGSAARRKAGKT